MSQRMSQRISLAVREEKKRAAEVDLLPLPLCQPQPFEFLAVWLSLLLSRPIYI